MADVRRSYVTPGTSGSFSGLFGFTKNRNKKDKNKVAAELSQVKSYTLHKPIRRKFKRTPVKVLFYKNIICADLKSIETISKFNNNYTFVLCVVEIFSKKAYTRPVKHKNAAEILRAFKSIFKEMGYFPKYCWTDMGTEFRNQQLQTYFKSKGVKLYHIFSNMKAMICERFIQTLFNRIARYMTERNTLKFYDRLQEFTRSYNNTWHSTIKKRPNDINDNNWMETWFDVYYPRYKLKKVKAQYDEGQHVRISVEKGKFDKGSKNNFSAEIFVISRVKLGNPVVYFLKDLNGEDVTGQFYGAELVAVPPPAKLD